MMSVMEKLGKGAPRTTGSLQRVDVSQWAKDSTGLKELRDLREVQSLNLMLTHLQHHRLPEAVDVAAQRIKSILMAKQPKGSWDKSTLVELLPCDSHLIAGASEIALAGLPP